MFGSLSLTLVLALAAPAPAVWTSSDDLPALASLLREADGLLRRGDLDGLDALFDRAAAEAPAPAVRARARFEQLRREVRRGDLGALERLGGALGIAPWAVFLGPEENTGGSRLAEPTAAEVAGLATALAGEGVLEVDLDPRDAHFDLSARLPGSDDVMGLLVLGVEADAERPAALRLSSSGQVVAFVNGQEVLRRDVHRPLGWDQDAVGVRLVKGKNLIALRVGNLSGSLGVRVRLTAPDGAGLPGVTWLRSVPDLVAAAGAGPAPGARVVVRDPLAEIDAFVAAPPLTRAPPPGGPDLLADAIVVERATRSRDQRAQPPAHELWMLALSLRQKMQPPGAERDAALARALADIGDQVAAKDGTVARARYEEALTLDEGCAPALVGMARLRAEQDLEQDALLLYRLALAAAPDDDHVWVEAQSFARLAGRLKLDTDRAVLARAERSQSPEVLELGIDVAEGRGDVSLARSLAARLLARDAGNLVAHRVRLDELEAALADGATPEELAAVEARLLAQLAQRPHQHRTARQLALLWQSQGRHDDVARLLEDRGRRYPRLAEVPALAAELALWRGEADDARRFLLEALGRTPQDRELAARLRSIDRGEDDVEALWGLDLERLTDEEVPPGAREVGAHVVARTLVARTFENGLGTVFEDRILRIHDAEKAAALRYIAIPYTEGREVVEVTRSLRITRDGRREPARDVVDQGPDGKVGGVYTDVRQLVVDFGQLEDGDLIQVRTRKDLVGEQNLFGDFFGLIEPIQLAVPVQRWQLVVELPAARTLTWGGRGVPAPEVTEADGRRTYRFERTGVPRLLLEENMPPFLDVADYLSVSSYQSWEELGDWFERLIENQLRPDEALRAAAREQTRGARTDAEKVRRLYEYVIRHTRYVGIELGIHGWKPYPVAEVHRRQYGDCKDKASLLIALLHEVGIEGRLALVRTADQGVLEGSPPSMWSFNHAIAYVPSLDLFLDGTAERSGATELPALDQGAVALLVAPYSDARPVLVQIPLKSGEENLNTSSYDLSLTADGGMTLAGTERFRGVIAADQRAQLEDAGVRREQLERSLSGVLPGVQVTSLDVTDLGVGTPEVGYTFTATVPHRAVVEENGDLVLDLSLYPHELADRQARRSERTQDVWIEYPWRTRNVMRYRLPPGFEVVDLPGSQVVEDGHLRFEQRITRTADGFVVDEDTWFKVRRVPVADYVDFRRTCVQADRLMKRQVRLVRQGHGS